MQSLLPRQEEIAKNRRECHNLICCLHCLVGLKSWVERVRTVCAGESVECLMTCLNLIAEVALMTGVKSMIEEDSVIEHQLLYLPGIHPHNAS